jgi:hypothetical protein
VWRGEHDENGGSAMIPVPTTLESLAELVTRCQSDNEQKQTIPPYSVMRRVLLSASQMAVFMT